MVVVRRHAASLAVVLAMLPLSLTGCGLLDGFGQDSKTDASTPVDEGPERARTRVQAYLDAMTAKSAADGREQLCAPLQEAFDSAATGPNGDFATHFSISVAAITDVRATGADQEVSTSITVKVGGEAIPKKVLFTVARADGQWCIAKEAIDGNAPATSGSPAPPLGPDQGPSPDQG